MLLVLTWTACERAPDSTDPRPVAGPRLELSSETLSFPALSIRETAVETLEARNVGDAPLQFDRVAISDGLAFEVVSSTDPIEVEPGGVYAIEIAFSAMGSGENTGTLTLESNAANDPNAEVALVGVGSVPLLGITPASFTFDATGVPCGDATELRLWNDGSGDLTVSDLDYEANGALALEPTEQPLPWTLAPGEARFVWIRFAPRSAGAFTGRLSVMSNDPRGFVDAEQVAEASYDWEGDETFPIRADETQFQLTQVPVPASVEVRLDSVPTGLFTVAGRVVTVLEPDLATRDEVVISYGAAAECN
jgi:hypothetical protein